MQADSLPPTQEVTTYNDFSAKITDSLPPSDFSMREYSLADVTNSDVDTQVVLDLMKGRTDSGVPSSKETPNKLRFLTTNFVPAHSHVLDIDTQLACSSFNADTIESFPVRSLASHDDIQDEMITPKDCGKTDTTISDAVLDCDCHVSVLCDSHSLISSLILVFHRWRTNAYCVKADARGGIIFGM